MAEARGEWMAGDMARCVDVGDLPVRGRDRPARGGKFLQLGETYRVRSVITWRPALGVLLDIGAPCGPKLARRFEKVPAAQAELFVGEMIQ